MRTITINTENLQIASVRNFIGRIDRFNFRMVKDGINIDGIISAWIVSKLKTTNNTCVANLKEMRATLDAINVTLENHDSGIKVLTDKALKAKNESKSKLETKIVAENAKVENMMLFINDNPKLLELATEYSKNAPACDGIYFEYLYRYFDGKYFTAERHKAMADLVSAVCKEKRTSCYVLEKKIQDTINGRALIDLVKRDFNRFSHMKNDMSIFKPYTPNMKTWEYYFVADYIASNVLKETKDGVVLVSESYKSVASKMYRFQILKLQGNKITAMNIDDLK